MLQVAQFELVAKEEISKDPLLRVSYFPQEREVSFLVALVYWSEFAICYWSYVVTNLTAAVTSFSSLQPTLVATERLTKIFIS